MDQFNVMQNDILQEVLDHYLRPKSNEKRAIELYLTNTCNLKCSYCYLWHNRKLYPKDLADSSETIVKNTGIFLDYLIENKVTAELNIFSGEFFMLPYWEDVLNLIYKKYQNIIMKPELIVIPSNCTFLFNEKTTEKVEHFIKIFRDIGMRLHISMSVDGKYAQDVRFGKPVDDSFYEKVFEFKKKYSCGFHPMVGKESIKHWKQNLDWIVSMYNKYDIKQKHMVALEVRNDYWSDEDIEDYIDFLGYSLDLNFKLVNGDVKKFVDSILVPTNNPDATEAVYAINYLRNIFNQEQRITCGIQHRLHVRVGDLAIGPCHRLFYDQFIYGKFVVEHDKIIGLNAQNISSALSFTHIKGINLPKCSKCPYRYLCLKGCLGSQFEANNDPFMPCESVCKLMKRKFDYMISKFSEMGVLSAIMEIPIASKRINNLVMELRNKHENIDKR